ncbi:hypothetical protein SNE40_012093 [Patella caerulea]|uniref:Uncharacterized protein n=1 Tax=Patella caerulea TaxID=87958 RepID=A0AAN8JL29_PATCE
MCFICESETNIEVKCTTCSLIINICNDQISDDLTHVKTKEQAPASDNDNNEDEAVSSVFTEIIGNSFATEGNVENDNLDNHSKQFDVDSLAISTSDGKIVNEKHTDQSINMYKKINETEGATNGDDGYQIYSYNQLTRFRYQHSLNLKPASRKRYEELTRRSETFERYTGRRSHDPKDTPSKRLLSTSSQYSLPKRQTVPFREYQI